MKGTETPLTVKTIAALVFYTRDFFQFPIKVLTDIKVTRTIKRMPETKIISEVNYTV